MKNPPKEKLRAGEVAAQAGVGVQTLHYYERLGLLSKPERSPANHRLYSFEALRRVRFIKKAQSVGFTLTEIKELFRSRHEGTSRCRRVLELSEKRFQAIDEQIAALQAFRTMLSAVLPKWRKDTGGRKNCAGEFCDLIERLK